MSTPWKKILADLWKNKTRSILAALSVAVGVFSVGAVSSVQILTREAMTADYLSINPRTARIYMETFDDKLVKELTGVPGVTAIEGRYDTWVKATAADGRQYPVDLTAITSLDQLKVDQLVFEAGSHQLGNQEIYLERQGADGLGMKVGDTVELLMKNGQSYPLKIVGTVHDANANPFKINSQTAAYVTPQTMTWLGEPSQYNNVAFITDGSHTDIQHVRNIAEQVANKIQQAGKEVYSININNPGQHPAQSIVDTVSSLLAALTILVVFLSVFLVINTISAIMSQQVRQIGVMKALGATMSQLIIIYLAFALAFGLLALLIAIPLSVLVAYGFTGWLLGMLNANPLPFYLPPISLFLQIGIGLAVPLLSALVPVLGGTRLTIREAITNYGLSSSSAPGLIERLLASLRSLPRLLTISLTNTFRRKGRLTLTLFTLTLGGAIFMAVFSTRDAIFIELGQGLGYTQSDINVNFSQPYPLTDLQAATQGISGIVSVEGWWSNKLNVMHPDGLNSDQVQVYAPPADTRLISPILTEGRWLKSGDENAVVVDNQFLKARPDVKVNDTINLRIDKQNYAFTVVGIFRLASNSAIGTVYTSLDSLRKIYAAAGQVNSLRIVTDLHTSARQNEISKVLQANFITNGLDASLQTGSEVINQQQYMLNLVIMLLLSMAVLVALVGGIGLMGSMGMNVMERTREIGVMRSIGAVNQAIFQVVVSEGLLIGMLSWSLGAAISIPISQQLNRLVGISLLNVPLQFTFSLQGLWLWLGAVLVLSGLASLLPARNAVRLTVRDVLAYE